MLRGNALAKVDSKGRIKIPNIYRRYLEKEFGRDCFVTSDSGDYAKVYPMQVWADIEKKMAAAPSMNPAITKYRRLVSYYGQEASLDAQGRLLIHPILRESSNISGTVAVLGEQNSIDIWNQEKLVATLDKLSDQERAIVADILQI